MNRIAVALAATTTAALVLSGGAASAGTKSAKDRSRDAAPVADITRVQVDNAAARLTIKVKLTKPAAGRTHLVATLTPAAPAADAEPTASYVVRTVSAAPKGKGKGKARAQGRTTGVLETVPADGSAPVAVACPNLRVSLSAGRNGQAQIRVPQACFGADAGDWVVAVTTQSAGGSVIDTTKPLAVPQG